MFVTAKKEQFSLAFIHAVVTVAGFKCKYAFVDDDSVDIDVAASRGQLSGRFGAPQIGIQAKCTEKDDGSGDRIRYKLKAKNYDDLREAHLHIPRILVLVCVPSDTTWLLESEESLVLKRAAYWVSLRGAEPIGEQESKTVYIPRVNRFTVDALASMMKTVASEGQL